MSHQETYRHNEDYAEFLENWDAGFYAKYADALRPDGFQVSGVRRRDSSQFEWTVLDVGCGVGQVVRRLKEAGFQAKGVDVSEPNIRKAVEAGLDCQYYDGKRIPFEDESFDAAGALNVLEHVEEPESFIAELVRVVRPGGRIVLSSPNFLRVLGFRDYHRSMRGFSNKIRNALKLWAKRRRMIRDPQSVRFDRMEPVVREPFQPDDDAIVATNPLEMKFFLERNGCRVRSVSCADRYVARPVEIILNCSPLRYLMFNAFLIAEKNDDAGKGG